MRLIDADELKSKLQARHDNGTEDFDKGYNIGLGTAIDLIDSAPTVKPQKIVTIPPELIEKLASCVVNTIEKIDWDKAIEAYKERPQGKWIEVPVKRDILYPNGIKYVCTECKRDNSYGKPPFCMYCGADMRGEDHD